jgi:hypothetical protein
MNTGKVFLRLTIPEAAEALRMSRVQLYKRAKQGLIKIQKDGARSYVTVGELHRYVSTPGPVSGGVA